MGPIKTRLAIIIAANKKVLSLKFQFNCQNMKFQTLRSLPCKRVMHNRIKKFNKVFKVISIKEMGANDHEFLKLYTV